MTSCDLDLASKVNLEKSALQVDIMMSIDKVLDDDYIQLDFPLEVSGKIVDDDAMVSCKPPFRCELIQEQASRSYIKIYDL